MGKHKFRISDMIPNAWFYKLRDMNTTRSRKSHYPKSKKHPQLSSPTSTITSTTTSFYLHRQNLCSPPLSHYLYDSPKRKTVYKPSENRTALLGSPTSSSDDDDSVGSARSGIEPMTSFLESRAGVGKLWHSFDDDSATPPELDTDSDSMRELVIEPVTSYFESRVDVKVQGHVRLSDDDDGGDDNTTLPEPEKAGVSFQPRKILSKSCDGSTSSGSVHTRKPEIKPLASFLESRVDVTEPEEGVVFPPRKALSKSCDGSTSSDSIHRKRSGIKPLTSYYTKLHCHSSDDDSTTLSEPEGRINSQPRKAYSKSSGVRLRANASPRKKILSGGRKIPSTIKKELPESVAMVKASLDPQKDFRESMMNMIVENNIRSSKELEELLASYLSLNSSEYHHIIIMAFEQIWFQIPNLQL